MLALFRLVVHEGPEEHPHKAQAADDYKGPLPSQGCGQRRNAQRGGQSAHRGTCVEDGGGKSPVLLGEILCRHLDGGREVTRFTQRQNTPAQQEQPDGDGGNHHGYLRTCFHSPQRLHGAQPGQMRRTPAAGSVQAGAGRPDADGNEVPLFGTHPVHELAGKQAYNGVKNGKERRNGAVVGIGPVEFRLNELFVCEREHLAVQIVHSGSHKQQRAQPPAPVGHELLLGTHTRSGNSL